MVTLRFLRCLCYTLSLSLAGVSTFASVHPPVHACPSADARLSAGAPPFASMEKDILRLVNQYRHSKRLPPLQINQLESTVAEQHSRNMASGRTPFGHEGFHQRSAYLNKKMGPIRVMAENVASGQMSASEVVDGWLHSPGHRRNIEGDFRLTGIGLARGSRGMIYFTQIFTR